jgi:hypothetical protein
MPSAGKEGRNKKLLKFPQGYELMIAIAIGFPAATKEPTRGRRTKLISSDRLRTQALLVKGRARAYSVRLRVSGKGLPEFPCQAMPGIPLSQGGINSDDPFGAEPAKCYIRKAPSPARRLILNER